MPNPGTTYNYHDKYDDVITQLSRVAAAIESLAKTASHRNCPCQAKIGIAPISPPYRPSINPFPGSTIVMNTAPTSINDGFVESQPVTH